MTGFGTTVERLAAQLTSAHAWRGVDVTLTREPALRQVGTGRLLVAALRGARRRPREQLIGALVRQAQRSPDAVWTSALIVGCAPWLERLMARLSVSATAREDIESDVLMAFLTTVSQVRTRRLITSTWLRCQTWRRLHHPSAKSRPTGRARVRLRRLGAFMEGGRA